MERKRREKRRKGETGTRLRGTLPGRKVRATEEEDGREKGEKSGLREGRGKSTLRYR